MEYVRGLSDPSAKKRPVLLWGFQIFIGYMLYRMDAANLVLILAGLAALLSFFRHKASYTLSAMLWLFVTFQTSRGITEPAMWILPVLTLTVAFLTFYFTQYPYVNSRTGWLGQGHRVAFVGEALLRKGDITWPAQVISMSASGISLRGDFNLKLGERVEIEINDLDHFKSDAKIMGADDGGLRLQFTGLSLASVFEHFKIRRHVRKTLKSNAGYSLLEVVIVAGVGSIMMLAANQIFMDTSVLEKKAKQDFWIETLKNEILNQIRQPAAWKNTLAAPVNTSADCLKTKSVCVVGTDTGPLAIYDMNGNVVFDSTKPTSGFTPGGQLCNTYDTGANDCKFRFNITWTPVCTDSCINPDIKIDLIFASKTLGRELALNSGSRSITLYRSPIYDSVEETCNSIGGVFSAATGNCVWTRMNSTCGSQGKVLVGFDAAGAQICENFPARDCAPGTWLVGFNPNGDLLCEVR